MATVLFKTTATEVRCIADRLNNMMISDIQKTYIEKYGAGWKLKLQGDIVATAVEWCHRDYTCSGYTPTTEEMVDAWYEYTYFDLFEDMGLSELRPSKALEEGLVSTYAHAMLEAE